MGSVGAAKSSGGGLNNVSSSTKIARYELTVPGFSTPIAYVRYFKEAGGDDRFYRESMYGIPDITERSITEEELVRAITRSGAESFSTLSRDEMERERERRTKTTSGESETTSRESRRLAKAAAGTRRASKRGRPKGSR